MAVSKLFCSITPNTHTHARKMKNLPFETFEITKHPETSNMCIRCTRQQSSQDCEYYLTQGKNLMGQKRSYLLVFQSDKPTIETEHATFQIQPEKVYRFDKKQGLTIEKTMWSGDVVLEPAPCILRNKTRAG